jgi:manganese-dependent inorganic pyrophosphatase
MKKETIYVVGHRNPDTDSVCSALAYAHLQKLQGYDNVLPGRAGNLNRQTEFVLEELGVAPPQLLTDVVPRVRDVVRQPAVTIEQGTPLAWALDLMHARKIGLLPVVDSSGSPQGLLSLRQVAERFLVAGQEERIRRVRTSPACLGRCLRAEILEETDSEQTVDLDLYVGAMAFGSFCRRMQGLDPRRLLVVTGDREDIQLHAAKLGVRLLVITGDGPVKDAVRAAAREHGVTLLTTVFDTATTASLARLATPVECLMVRDFATVGLDDAFDELRYKLLQSRLPGVVVLDPRDRVAAVGTKSTLLASFPVKLILVDHNELTQSVPGAERVEIIEIIDHHRLGNVHTDTPIRFINQPFGSTCTIVAGLYRQAGRVPDARNAGLMLAGLLSDTVMLKSPTTTEVDRDTARWLADLSGLDMQDFGTRMFGAGSTLAAYVSMEELVLADFKEYSADGRCFGVGQVEVVGFDEFHGRRDEIVAVMENLRRQRGMAVIGLLVTDIVRATSLLLVTGQRDLIRRIDYPRLSENLYELQGVLSRKKQLLPYLLKIAKG